MIAPPAILLVVRGMILARRVPVARTTATVTINQDMKALKPADGINPGFLALSMDAAQEAFVPLIDEAGHGTRRLPTERWREIAVALPPGDEQATIVRYLEQATGRTLATIDRAHRKISLLREYRTRLIADVVTGKLDVREAAARLPHEADEPVALQDTDALLEGDSDTNEADLDSVPAEAEA